MGWERQISTVTNLPEEPSLIFWLIGGILAFTVSVLLFVLHANRLLGPLQHYSLWLFTGAPLFVWFVLICLRGWIYNSAVDRHEFEVREADYAQQQWVAWAGRYLAVLHSEVILPGSLTPAQFMDVSGREQHANQSLHIELQGDDNVISALLSNISDALSGCPQELPLNVVLLTDSASEAAVLQKAFDDAWRVLVPARPVPSLNILRSHTFDVVERRLKTPSISIELILVQQIHGGERYSDALATLLLTSDDVVTKYHIEHHARLLRPMPLDTNDILGELELYFSTQTQANATQYIFGDSVRWGESFPVLLDASEKHGGYWKTEQLHWLETYAGISGPFSPWITVTVVSDVVQIQQADCLMLTEDERQPFINTVTAGIRNEE